MHEQNNLPAPRTPTSLEVVFRKNYARADWQGVLKNISLTGAFIQQDNHQMQAKDKIVVTLSVFGRERQLPAKVVWINGIGAGIKFMPNNNRDVQLIDDLIYFIENRRSDVRNVFDTIFKKAS